MNGLVLERPERLAALVPLLLLLYWLARPPRPRRRLDSAHLQQWQRALQRIGRRPIRLRRLRFWLLCLAAAAICLAATAPRLGVVEGATRLVILLDDSASMRAEQLGVVAGSGVAGSELGGAASQTTTAWGLARDRAVEQVRSLPEGVEVRLVRVSAERDDVVDCELERLEQEFRRLPAPHAKDGPLAAVAERIVAGDRLGETVGATGLLTLTDGRSRQPLPGVGAVELCGRAVANAGIVAVAVEDPWPLPDVTVRVQVAMTTGRDTPPRLVVEGGVDLRTQSATKLDSATSGSPPVPGLTLFEITAALRRTDGGAVELALDEDSLAADAFPADDRIALRLPAPPEPRIALRGAEASGRGDGGDESGWLTRAARALADLSGGRVVGAAGSTEPVSLLLSGAGWQREAAPRQLSFGTRFGDAERLRPAAADPTPATVLDWDRDHPLMAGIDFSELEIRALSGRAESLPTGHEALLWGPDGALLAVVDQPGSGGSARRRSIHARFRLEDSNLPLLAAFPQLLRRSYSWLYGIDSAAGPRSAGAVTPPPLAAPALLDLPESTLNRLVASPAGAGPLPQFADPGRPLAVHLLVLAVLLLALRTWF